MKAYLLISFCLLFVQAVAAQKNFEGHVIYNIKNKQDSTTKFMDVYFKRNKICANIIDTVHRGYIPSQFIYNFEKGVLYEVYAREKIIVSTPLKKRKLLEDVIYEAMPGLSKDILGYPGNKYHMWPKGLKHQYDADINCWFSPGITFALPEALCVSEPFLFINGKTFSLEIEMITESEEETATPAKDTVTIKASAIEHKIIDDAVFIPDRELPVIDMFKYKEEQQPKFTAPRIVPGIPKKNKKAVAPIKKAVKNTKG